MAVAAGAAVVVLVSAGAEVAEVAEVALELLSSGAGVLTSMSIKRHRFSCIRTI